MTFCYTCHWRDEYPGCAGNAAMAQAPEDDVLYCENPLSPKYEKEVDEFDSCPFWNTEDVLDEYVWVDVDELPEILRDYTLRDAE